MPLKPYLSISKCRICKHLDEEEYAMQKYGWPEGDTFLPKAATKLKWVGAEPLGSRYRKFQICPVCGLYYHYELNYEYLVNGTEDEETLTRLTPTDFKDKISPGRYDQYITNFKKELNHGGKRSRCYAAKSLAAHYWSTYDIGAINRLLRRKDDTIVRGVFDYLAHDWLGSNLSKAALKPLVATLEALTTHSDKRLAWKAEKVMGEISIC